MILPEDLEMLVINHENRIQRLEHREGRFMAQLADVQAQIDALVAEDGVVVQALADLKSKVDAGGQVTSADLDNLQAQLAGEVSRLSDAVNTNDPGVNPATTTPTPTGDTTPVDQPTDTQPGPDTGGMTPPDAAPTQA